MGNLDRSVLSPRLRLLASQQLTLFSHSTASMRNKYKDGMPLKYGTDEANVRLLLSSLV